MASLTKQCSRDKAALWRTNKEKIRDLITRGLKIDEIVEELQKGGCRITAQIREHIIWEKRVPEVRGLLLKGLDVPRIEEIMRANGWIWTDNIKKKAWWEFYRDEIIAHYQVLRSVEAVREKMVKRGFPPQPRIYYEWLRRWGISTSRPPGSSSSATPSSTNLPCNPPSAGPESSPWESSQSSAGDIVSCGDSILSQNSSDYSRKPIAITAHKDDGQADCLEMGAMDLDTQDQIGDFISDHSSSNMRSDGFVTPSEKYYGQRASQQIGHGTGLGIHPMISRYPFQDDGEISDDAKKFSYNFHATTGYDTSPLSSIETTMASPWSEEQLRSISGGRHKYFPDPQRATTYRDMQFTPEQNASGFVANRKSNDSGYGSHKSFTQPIGIDYSSPSRRPSGVDQETNSGECAPPKCSLHSISCTVDHQGMGYNFSCCGSSRLQEVAFSALRMSTLHVYQNLCYYMQCEDIRRWDHAGNTFLHKLAISNVPWAYIKAGLKARINPCHQNAYGQTFLHVLNISALGNDLVECLTTLKTLGMDFGLRDAAGRTFLHCLYDQPMSAHMAQQILELVDVPGRRLSLRDASGRTPCEVFKHTFRQQASSNLRASSTDPQPQIFRVFEDIADGEVISLKEKGVDVSKNTDNPEHLRDALQSQYKEVIDKASGGIAVEALDGSNAFHAQAALTAIHDASTDLRDLEKFISLGIDTNDYDNWGRTPLEAIITQPRDFETELTTSEKVSLLVEKGKANVHSRNRLGQTPLYSAAIRGLGRTVEALLLHNSHPNIRANDGQSLLQAVIDAGYRSFLEYCESGICQYHDSLCSRIEECKTLLVRVGAVADPTPAQAMGYLPDPQVSDEY